MMSNSNYSIGLQRLKPIHTAYGAMHAHQETVNALAPQQYKSALYLWCGLGHET